MASTDLNLNLNNISIIDNNATYRLNSFNVIDDIELDRNDISRNIIPPDSNSFWVRQNDALANINNILYKDDLEIKIERQLIKDILTLEVNFKDNDSNSIKNIKININFEEFLLNEIDNISISNKKYFDNIYTTSKTNEIKQSRKIFNLKIGETVHLEEIENPEKRLKNNINKSKSIHNLI